MSQAIFSDIVPGTTSGNQLAVILNDFKDAVASGMTGTSRPTNLQAGGAWIDTTTTTWLYKVYTGTADITVYSLNTVTNTASISSSSNVFSITKISADDAPPVLELKKERISGGGQVLIDDELGSVEMSGKSDTSTKQVGAKITAVATNDFLDTEFGTDLVFWATNQSTTLLEEKMRIVDGKLGIGTPIPTETLHVKGSGIRSEKSSDDAVGARVILRKRRTTGFGTVQNNDILGQVEFNSTDGAGTEILAAKIVSKATQAHTSSVQGNSLAVNVKKIGSNTFVEQLVFGEQIDFKDVIALVEQVDSATTGSGQSLSTTKSLVKVTNASLTSINNLAAPTDGRLIVLINGTGATITITNDSGGTAANRIRTGTGIDLLMSNNSSIFLVYDNNSTRWQIVGGSGGGSLNVTAVETISSGGTITTTAVPRQLRYVKGNSGEVTVSTTPFGSAVAWADGTEIILIGDDDSNTIVIPYNDASKGCVGNFSSITLTKFQRAAFIFSSTHDRFIYQG